jgi:hypothetical protein
MACVVHVHSTHSDGTGTVAQIAAAARRAGADAVLLTDHDTLAARRAGEERWHGPVLVCVGAEVSPLGENHYLAFGTERHTRHRGRSPAEVCDAVAAAGGFGFAAHPFSKGSARFRQPPMAWADLDCVDGIEVWSVVTDVSERVSSVGEALRFLARPERYAIAPPEENLREWDRLNRARRVVAVGGIDAHQIGKRLFDRWVVRLMGYARSFRLLRTHVLVDELPTGDVERDRAQVFDALREGRSYIAVDHLARPAGFGFWDDGGVLRVRVPRPAELRLVKDGAEVARLVRAELDHAAEDAGSYRVEARLDGRVWILSNPLRVG